MTLVIFEVALFWQDVNAIYNLNAEINANVALIDPATANPPMAIGSRCPAALEAIRILKTKDSMISMSKTNYNDLVGIDDPGLVLYGKEPFALYRYVSDVKVNANPQITLWVDCRSPFEQGITTQIEFYHKTVVMKATIPRFDKPQGIVIIPDNVFIASPKLNTMRHY